MFTACNFPNGKLFFFQTTYWDKMNAREGMKWRLRRRLNTLSQCLWSPRTNLGWWQFVSESLVLPCNDFRCNIRLGPLEGGTHNNSPPRHTHTTGIHTTWMSTWQVFLSLNVFGRVSAHQGQVMTHFNSCLPYLATYPSDTFSFPHSPLPFGVAQYVFLLLWVDSYFGEI